MAAQNVNVARPKPPRLHQKPDRNAGANNAGFTTTHLRVAFDTGKGVSQVLAHALKQLDFFDPAQSRYELFHFLAR
jgi:hypothetical protein